MFAAGPERGPDSQYCKLAKFQRNAPSWNAYYGCLRGPARQAYASAPMPAPTGRFADRTFAAGPERGPNSQYSSAMRHRGMNTTVASGTDDGPGRRADAPAPADRM